MLDLLELPASAQETNAAWINKQSSESLDDLSSLLTSLLLLQSDIQTEQAAISLQLITSIPQLSSTIKLTRRHVLIAQSQIPAAIPHIDQTPIETLKAYRLLSSNLKATSDALTRHQKWLSIQTDVANNMNNFELCTALLSDALLSTSIQRTTLDPLCDTVADNLCKIVEDVLERSVYDAKRMGEVWKWCDKIGRTGRFEEVFLGRSKWYVEAYKRNGFDGTLGYIREDSFVTDSTLDVLLTAFVSSLSSDFQRDITSDIRSFYSRAEMFVASVGGSGEWARGLVTLFLDYTPKLVQTVDSLSSLFKASDDLLKWCSWFLQGHYLHRLPAVLAPSFKRLLALPPIDMAEDPWMNVDALCLYVESLLVFQNWFSGFVKRYDGASCAKIDRSGAYTFLGFSKTLRFEYSLVQCYSDADTYMGLILLAPIRLFIDSPVKATMASSPSLSYSSPDLKLPRFSESPSDGIVFAAEYILTLPQYLDLFKERQGFIKLGDDGVIAWTYFVARRVKTACAAGVDLDYFSNVCRVIGMD